MVMQLLQENPWLVPCGLAAGVIVGCVAIVFITDYLRKTRQIEIEAWLKQDMLNRGLSPEQIKTVLEARSDGEARRLCASQGVRVGLGNFQVKVGSMDESAPHAAHR
jgi:hypothetical protein